MTLIDEVEKNLDKIKLGNYVITRDMYDEYKKSNDELPQVKKWRDLKFNISFEDDLGE